jgi:hypothetical protein
MRPVQRQAILSPKSGDSSIAFGNRQSSVKAHKGENGEDKEPGGETDKLHLC